jgi:hypothetical protein
MGALAYGARIGQLTGTYTTRKIEFLENRSSAQSQEMNELRAQVDLWLRVAAGTWLCFYLFNVNEWCAQELRFLAAHFALIPFELGFVIVAMLQVSLHRSKQATLAVRSD